MSRPSIDFLASSKLFAQNLLPSAGYEEVHTAGRRRRFEKFATDKCGVFNKTQVPQVGFVTNCLHNVLGYARFSGNFGASRQESSLSVFYNEALFRYMVIVTSTMSFDPTPEEHYHIRSVDHSDKFLQISDVKHEFPVPLKDVGNDVNKR